MRFGARYGLVVVATVTFISTAPATATAIDHLEITHNEGSYAVSFDVRLTADPNDVWERLSDYRRWPQLSDTLEESRLLQTFADGRQRIALRFRSCVLVFCKTIQQVKDVSIHSNGNILTVMVPEGSDFISGEERWQIGAEQNGTRVRYRAEVVPGFRLPPVIGPWILKAKLRRTLIETAKKLELPQTP